MSDEQRRSRSVQSLETHRLTVTFSEEAWQWIEAQAIRHAISYAEVVRRVIDETRGAQITPSH